MGICTFLVTRASLEGFRSTEQFRAVPALARGAGGMLPAATGPFPHSQGEAQNVDDAEWEIS